MGHTRRYKFHVTGEEELWTEVSGFDYRQGEMILFFPTVAQLPIYRILQGLFLRR
jgi:hypothetical protein